MQWSSSWFLISQHDRRPSSRRGRSVSKRLEQGGVQCRFGRVPAGPDVIANPIQGTRHTLTRARQLALLAGVVGLKSWLDPDRQLCVVDFEVSRFCDTAN